MAPTTPVAPPPTPPRSKREAWQWPAVVAALGLLLAAALTWFAWSGTRARDQARFDNSAQRIQTVIATRLDLYIGMLRAGAGLFAASDDISREEFRAFADRIDLPDFYPGAQGIGFARRVTRAELAGFIAERRHAEEEPSFDVFPPGEREDYFPITFLEPLDRRNLRALGYDMFSEPKRQAAMARARDHGGAAATATVVLVQEIDQVKQPGFLVYVPVYRPGPTPETIEARREQLEGFVYSPFRAHDLFGGLLESEPPTGVRFDVYESAAVDPRKILYRSLPEPLEDPTFTRTAQLRVADRDWTVSYRSTAAFDARSARSMAAWIGVASLLVSIAMGAIALALARTVARAQARERDLFLEKERLRVTLASIGDAVVCTDEEGRVTFLNPIAEQLTGWSQAEALGRFLPGIAPLIREGTNHPLRNPVEVVLRRGVTVTLTNHTVLVSRSGRHIPIEDSAAPIRREDGTLSGVVLVFHDVTEKRRSELALRERERLLAAVAGGAAVGLAIIDERYGHVFANGAYARALGQPEDQVIGRSVPELAGAAWPALKPSLDHALAGHHVSHEVALPGPGNPGGEPSRCFTINYEPHGEAETRSVVAVMLDITERKRAEEELQISEERGRLAVAAGRLGTWDYAPLSGDLIWDARCRQLFGVTPETNINFDLFLSLLHPDDRESIGKLVRSALDPASKGRCDMEYRIIRPLDGAERWVRATGQSYFEPHPENECPPAPAPAGRAYRFVGTVQDITDAKRKEATLRFLVDLGAATQRLVEPDEIMKTTARMLGDHLAVDRCAYAEIEDESVFIITGDHPRGVPSIVGRWPVAAFGSECHRLMLANEPYIVVDSENDERIGPQDLPAYRATAIRAVICVPLHKAGKFTAAMAVHQARPRRWSADEIHLVEMVVARCWESLERGRTIDSLRESEARLRFMAEAMPQKIFTATRDGAVDYVNRQWLDFTGVSQEEMRNWGWLNMVHPDDRAENIRRWKHCLESGAPFQIEHRFRRRDGEFRWHLTRASPLRTSAGEISMWIGSNTDITEMVKARETLAERREELERIVDERTASLRKAVEQMEEFSYSISHDLRAPLRAMQGYAEALLEDHAERLDDEARGYLRRIVAASSRMDRLTLDVLTYSKVSREPVQPQRVSLERLVTDCVRQHVDFRSARADVVIEHPLPDVLGHEPLLMQVVSNLVGNALKFVAPRTDPRVRIHAEENEGAVRLWIEDNGIGVPPQHQRRIWGMFERAHPTSGYAGTGIGLAIVRKAVERMGGQVGVESDGRSGSRFWIQLPAPAEVENTPAHREPPPRAEVL